MKKLMFLVVSVCLALPAFAQIVDQPEPGEPFPTFFARLTKGGHFPGIYVNPPLSIQESFLKTIRLGYWVGKSNKVKAKLQNQNVDLWGDWFVQTQTFNMIFNQPAKKAAILEGLKIQIGKSQNECAPSCPQAEQILNLSWKDLDFYSRQVFIKAYIFSTPIFNGRTLFEYLGDVYQFPAKTVEASTRIQLLSTSEFAKAVRAIGYEGPIYFRGITAPDPLNPQGHLILLDQQAMANYSAFTRPLLQTLEIAGILVHELSHVFQDLKGRAIGSDVQVRSAEAALILEGSAEYLAEEAMTLAALQEQGPSALELFVAEQAVEIVDREGNASSGRLFPYTIGLPFAAALYNRLGNTPADHEALTNHLLTYLGGNEDLSAWLQRMFPN